MKDSSCNRSCLMKTDLKHSTEKLSFLKDNWPSFGQIECIASLSKEELECSLCLIDVLIDAFKKEEFICPYREIIRFVMTRTYIQNCIDLYEYKE